MTISKEQTLIVDYSIDKPILKVNALAGTGKTSTLVFVALANPNENILYMVFNKANQLEAIQKFPENVFPRTTHSLAYAGVANNTNINLKAVTNYSYKDIADLFEIDYNKAYLVFKEFDEFCNGDDLEFKNKKSYASKLFEKMRKSVIPPSHSFYLKLFHLLLTDGMVEHSYTMAMIDESQDTNLVTLAIFNLLNIPKKIYVGDENQRIYSFRGSKNIFEYVEGENLYLSETFRSAKPVVDLANIVLKKFKGFPVEMTTNVKIDKNLKNKAYISRTNSSLIGKIDNLIKRNEKFKTIREPKFIFSLVIELYYFEQGEKYKIRENNYLKKFKNMNEIINYSEDTDSVELKTALKILEKYGKKIFDFKSIADKYFYDKTLKVSIFLTTAHTSKGLEWDEVEIVDDFKPISKIISKTKYKKLKKFIKNIQKVNPESIDEINLLYVAITRARQLVYIPPIISKEFYMEDKEFNKVLKEKRKSRRK